MSNGIVRLDIRLMGTPEVFAGAGPLALNQLKSRALLFYLAATGQSTAWRSSSKKPVMRRQPDFSKKPWTSRAPCVKRKLDICTHPPAPPAGAGVSWPLRAARGGAVTLDGYDACIT
jgi:hypothetical protein